MSNTFSIVMLNYLMRKKKKREKGKGKITHDEDLIAPL